MPNTGTIRVNLLQAIDLAIHSIEIGRKDNALQILTDLRTQLIDQANTVTNEGQQGGMKHG